MNRQCAWCKESMDDVTFGSTEQRKITHGICRKCISNIEFQRGVEICRFLDFLDVPLFVRDENDHVKYINQAASTLLGIDRSVFTAGKQGVVFECQYARRPEGCGRTMHCSGCAIRTAIEHTYETGQGVLQKPAVLKQNDKDVRLHLTTEKIGNMVVLRIDEMMAA